MTAHQQRALHNEHVREYNRIWNALCDLHDHGQKMRDGLDQIAAQHEIDERKQGEK